MRWDDVKKVEKRRPEMKWDEMSLDEMRCQTWGVRLNETRSDQMKWDEVKLDETRWDEMWDVKWNDNESGQKKWDEIKLDEVRGDEMWDLRRNKKRLDRMRRHEMIKRLLLRCLKACPHPIGQFLLRSIGYKRFNFAPQTWNLQNVCGTKSLAWLDSPFSNQS